MTEIPKEISDIIQNDTKEKIKILWKEIVQCAQIDQDVKMCRHLLNRIELLKMDPVSSFWKI